MTSVKVEHLKRRTVYGLILLLVWLFVGTLGFHLIEGWGYVDSFYMTVITISTVGYGEVHPLSSMGRLFASSIIIVTLGTVFYVFTMLGQFVVEGGLMGVLTKRRVYGKMKKLKDHFIVCGYGRIGRTVVEGLMKRKVPFVIIDSDAELEEEFRRLGLLYIIGDATDENVLIEAGIERAGTIISLLKTDADNLYVTLSAKGLNPNIFVISRALDGKAEVKMLKAGADKVISPYKLAGLRILQAALKPTVLEFLELVTTREYLPLALEEIKVTASSPLAGLTLGEADVRKRYGAIVIAIKRKDEKMVFNPGPETRIEIGDTLLIIGKEEDLKLLGGIS